MSVYLGNDLIGNIYVGTSPAGVTNVPLATPTISVSGSGLITANVIQSTAGYVVANSSASAAYQLSTANGATITPSSTSQVAIASGKYALDTITVSAVPAETGNISANGTYTPSTGKWFSSVIVNVPSNINNQNKTITPTTAAQAVSADSGYTGLGTVTVNPIPNNYIIPSGTKSITANGTGIDVTNYASVNVNVAGGAGAIINNQDKTITPTIATQAINADDGYTGLGTVTINPIPNNYIIPTGSKSITQNGTGIDVSSYATVNVNITPSLQAKTNISPTTSSQTITANEGYDGLSSVQINAMPVMTLPTAVSATGSGTLKATINRSTADQYINIPTGYNSTASNYKISAVPNGSVTAPVTISGSGATKTTGTNTLTLTKTISVTPNVTNAGYISAGTAGDVEVSLTAKVTTMEAQTITPNTATYALQKGTYLTGLVQIRGDTHLVAENIKSGVSIFGVNGTYTGAVISNQNKTITPSESSQSITADSGYTGLGTVTVNAITASYVGSGVARKSSTDLTISGATVTAPAGYYAANASKTMPNAELSTIALSYNSRENTFDSELEVTSGGYIAAGTITDSIDIDSIDGLTIVNTATTITPTETEQIAVDSGTFVTNQVKVGAITATYVGSGVTRRNNSDITASGATVTIPAGYYAAQQTKAVASGSAGIPTATKGTVSNHSISVTPSVTNTTGYITGGTKSGTAVTVSASELVSGTLQVTTNGTKDVTNYASVNVDINTVNNQNKTVTPSESSQSISADTGYTGLGTVTVNAITASYVGSGVTRRSSSNVTESLSYNSTNQKVTSSITVPAGYYESAGSKSISTTITDITDLPIQESLTITPSESTQTAITANTWASGAIQVAAITASYVGSAVTRKAAATITPTTSNQTIAAGTYLTGTQTIAGDADLVAGNIKSGVNIFGVTGTYAGTVINNQEKSATPTKATQEITPDASYTGLSKVTVNPIPASYITTTDADAVAANILLNKTAYVNGSKITGEMPNNGATGGTITAQGGTYTIPAGYTSGGTVTASLPATTLTNIIINGVAYEEDTGDYAWRSTINIPEGYHNASTITKDFSTILPAPDTPATSSQILIGYQVYDADGVLVTGTMPNNIYSNTLTDTRTSVTIPAGYHDGTGTVSHTTVNIPDPTITVSNSGLITASASWTKGFTTDNSYSNTKQLTTKAATTYTPTTASQSIAAGTYLTGAQTIQGDTNLVAGNIKSGVSIFGISGTYAGPGVNLQNKSVSPTESSQTISADSGYDGLGTVTVGAISTTYVGSGITSRSSSDLTVSGATVTAPAGYYASSASKSVATMTLPTATSSTSSGTSKLTIGRSTSDQYINIPTGYNGTASYYKISAVANGTVTAPSSISSTSASISTGTNTITLTKTVSVTPNVTSAGYISSGTAGNSSVSLTASVTTKAAATITPGTSNQTIASGTYLTGTQTIAGDADLVATNIKKGVQIFNVTGTYTSDATAEATDINSGKTAYVDGVKVTGSQVINKFYTGSSVPSSSLGNNGDIYLQT